MRLVVRFFVRTSGMCARCARLMRTGIDLTAKKPAANSTPRRHDWEAVSVAYRAGLLSVREIAKAYGIPESTIRKKATQEGWERALGDRVREAIQEKLIRGGQTETAAPGAQPHRARTRDEAIIEAAALTGAQLIIGHRVTLARLQRHRDLLLTRLEAFEDTLSRTDTERMLDGEKPLTIPERLDILQAQSQVLEQLSRVMFRLVPLERQAYALDAKNNMASGEGGGAMPKVVVVPAKNIRPPEVRDMNEEEIAALELESQP